MIYSQHRTKPAQQLLICDSFNTEMLTANPEVEFCALLRDSDCDKDRDTDNISVEEHHPFGCMVRRKAYR